LKEKKARHTKKKKLDTDFKNSLGCAVVAYEKQWSQKLYDFGKYCELQFNLIFLHESLFLSKLFLIWGIFF